MENNFFARELLEAKLISAVDLQASKKCGHIRDGDERLYRSRLSTHILTQILQEQNAESGTFRRQYLPSEQETVDDFGVSDPIGEEGHSPTTGLLHRYSSRAALYVTNACAAFCRFCLRKRKIGQRDFVIGDEQLWRALDYVREHEEIREVIVTGGDPLTLTNEKFSEIVTAVRTIQHVEIVRVCTRAPVQAPSRVDDGLCAILKMIRPVFVMLHVNHPTELTKEASEAIRRLGDSGIPVLGQTVLLKEINDNVEVLKELFYRLLKLGVKPYHLYQASRVRGTSHFIVPIEQATEIVGALWGHCSGLAVPIFVYNAEGGKGKIPLLPHGSFVYEDSTEIGFLNYKGELAVYHKQPVLPPTVTPSTAGREAVVEHIKA